MANTISMKKHKSVVVEAVGGVVDVVTVVESQCLMALLGS